MQFIDRVRFLNKSEYTQGLYCPRLEDKSLPEHVGSKTEILRWVEPQHLSSQLDTCIHPFTNNGGNNFLTVVPVFKNLGVKNAELDSDPRAERQMKPRIDRIGFTNGNYCNRSLYNCRVVRGHPLVCFGIRFYSPEREEIQKCSVNVMGNRTDSHTKSPDIAMETHLYFHSMYECTHSVGPLVATTNTKYHNHGFIRGLHGLVHATLHA